MVREYCKRCAYPKKTCICSHIIEAHLPFHISILQHPNESSNVKNTAKIAKLVDSTINIINSQSSSDIKSLKQTIETCNTVVLYPNNKSQELKPSVQLNALTNRQSECHLVLIDGTWRQAYQIWQTHTWLHSLPSFHFSGALQSKYKIRKSKLEHHLSTIEALNMFSSIVFKMESTPLNLALEGLNNMWERYASK